MRAFAFADIHGNKNALKRIILRASQPDIDILISAGDLTLFGKELAQLLKALDKARKYCLHVHGNHEDAAAFESACFKTAYAIPIHSRCIKIQNTAFAGWGGGGFAITEPSFERFASRIPKKAIIVTHAPPRNTKVDKIDSSHYGNKSITNAIKKVKPQLVICGHLHETAGRTDKIASTLIINPGPAGAILDIK